jgi:triosephosphate isomerase|tara:strand:- start:7336 stop:8022 length:687 start_codon:yes stop_codon:yes gene_type:complete
MKKYKTPTLVINLKNYDEIYSNYSIDISKISESIANETSVEIIVCPPNPVLYKVIDSVNIPIYAQHVDDAKIGSSTGSIVPELLKSINCPGSLINHSEKRIPLEEIEKLIMRFRDLELTSLVCAQSIDEVESIAKLKPDIIAIEPPELIGSGRAVSKVNPKIISDSVDTVKSITSEVDVLCGAGIMTGEDVSIALELGSKGILIASGIIKSNNWKNKIIELSEPMISK